MQNLQPAKELDPGPRFARGCIQRSKIILAVASLVLRGSAKKMLDG